MSSISIYSEIKDQVDTRKAVELYGYKINWNGIMCCPFHDDKTPSMKVDKDFYCFGYGEKGDLIRFVSLLFNLKPYDAALKLIDDMRLTITVRNDFRPSLNYVENPRRSLNLKYLRSRFMTGRLTGSLF